MALHGAPARVQGSLIVAAPSYVFSIAKVAKTLDEDEAWLERLAMR